MIAIIKNEDKRVLILQLYNQGKEFSEPRDLPKRVIIVLKELYVKVIADRDFRIRVDHVLDLIFVPGFDKCIPLS